MKKVLIVLIMVVLIVFPVYAEETLIDVTLDKCVDGDTMDLKVDGITKRFRLLAIDTPESVKPNTEVEAFGKEASEYTCELLTNAKKIQIEYDEKATVDKYDRTLIWLWVDGNLLQEELLGEGLGKVAYVYDNYKYVDELCIIQKVSKIGSIGIWKNDTDEGYCSTLKGTTPEEKEIEKVLEYGGNISKKSSEINETSDKVSDFISSDKFSLIAVIGLLIVAGISEIIKNIKK